MKDPFGPPDDGGKSDLKTSNSFFSDYNETYFSIQEAQREAVVMEKMTASPRIVDVYGHCGATVWVEFLSQIKTRHTKSCKAEVIRNVRKNQPESKHPEQQLHSQYLYSEEEKLDLALQMAESLADLHGFRDGFMYVATSHHFLFF